MSENIELKLTGNTNDLLSVSENDELKITRLFKNDEDLEATSVSLELVSNDTTKEHKFFNQLLNKKIEITLRVIE